MARLHVLVALHGIGGDGETFARDLTAAADTYDWVLVAPTIAYGDWMDPVHVAQEDATLINWLSAYLSGVASRTGQPIDPGVLFLGFSRGAQLAHRFAEAYPGPTLAVAAVSPGGRAGRADSLVSAAAGLRQAAADALSLDEVIAYALADAG